MVVHLMKIAGRVTHNKFWWQTMQASPGPLPHRRPHPPKPSQLHQSVRQQLERPTAAAFGHLRARQRDQPGLAVAVERALVHATAGAAVQGRLEAVLDKLLPHPLDRRPTDHDRGGDLLITQRRPTVADVGLQQNPCPHQLLRRRFARRNQAGQFLPFLVHQRHNILFLHRQASLPGVCTPYRQGE